MKILKKIFIIFMPLILMTLVFGSFSLISQEIYLFDNVINISDEDILYGVAFSDYNVEYKFKNLVLRNPDIAIIGTSRVMQFRQEFFQYDSYYNAGGIISKIGDLEPLLTELIEEGIVPDTIIVGLDQYFFNSNWDPIRESDSLSYLSRLRNAPNIVVPNRFRLLEAVLSEPQLLFNSSLISSKNFGLQGKVFNQGFRQDGSYYYGRYYELGERNDPDFSNTIDRIENGHFRFEYAESYNPKSIQELRSFLTLSKEYGINVIGFMPPFAPGINDIMFENGNYSYIDSVSIEITNLFNEFNYQYFDFTSMTETNDKNYIDGFHGDENVYGIIAAKISEFIS